MKMTSGKAYGGMILNTNPGIGKIVMSNYFDILLLDDGYYALLQCEASATVRFCDPS